MPKYLVTGGSGFIGTHLVQALRDRGDDVVSVDVRPPNNSQHMPIWRECDVTDKAALSKVMHECRPTHVIHLAAKANLNGKTIEDFPDNVLGTSNMVECVNDVDSVLRFVNTSTQYVVRPGIYPEHDELLTPYTAYGESKAVAEKIVREKCGKSWTIIRPTNIWGPLHPHFPHELWRYLQRGYYFHPGFRAIRKYYGYVGNAVAQILAISAQDASAAGKVFYITDAPIDSYDWMNAFSLALAHRKAKRIPRSLWYLMALAGTSLKRAGHKAPIDIERYFRLTVDESVPYQRTLELAGPPRYLLLDGVKRSVEWYEASNAN